MGTDCICGHAEEEHSPRSRSCEVEDCDCPCYEPEGDK